MFHPHGGAGTEDHRGSGEEKAAAEGVGVAAVALQFVGESRRLELDCPYGRRGGRDSGREGDGGSRARAPACGTNRPLEETVGQEREGVEDDG